MELDGGGRGQGGGTPSSTHTKRSLPDPSSAARIKWIERRRVSDGTPLPQRQSICYEVGGSDEVCGGEKGGGPGLHSPPFSATTRPAFTLFHMKWMEGAD